MAWLVFLALVIIFGIVLARVNSEKNPIFLNTFWIFFLNTLTDRTFYADHFEQKIVLKKFWKNHKFLSKIEFEIKKGWKCMAADPRRPETTGNRKSRFWAFQKCYDCVAETCRKKVMTILRFWIYRTFT